MTANIADTEPPRDNLATLIAIGLLAYASADIAHHVAGHGLACMALGGHIISLSSIFVDCSLRPYPADMAGPLANLGFGLVAFVACRWVRGPAASLFLGLAAGFNLLWFFMQFVFSMATRTDDFTWLTFHGGPLLRCGLIALGVLLCWAAFRLTASRLIHFAPPLARLRRIVWCAWLTAGTFACLTALFDHHPATAILKAAPQSLLLSIGLLLAPRYAARHPTGGATPIPFSVPWIASALVVAGFSIAFLGPGFSV